MNAHAVPVVLAGARGHGRWHLANIRRLADEGLVRLAGICELGPLTDEELAGLGTVPEQSPDLGELLDRTGAEIVVVCTPIHTHGELGAVVAARGAHLLLEKPPTPSAAAFDRLARDVAAAGIACQIGFQSLGSAAVDAIREQVAAGAIGAVRGIGAAGAWVRDEAYWRRAPWGGHRSLGGRDVVDGVLTNPLAHAVATALRIEGSDRAEQIASVDVELYRANDIAADDTSCARIRTTAGGEITAAVTLCAERDGEPYVVVHGDAGRLTLWYKADRVDLERPGLPTLTSRYGRTDLLANLVAHLREGAPLLVPLERTGAFTRLVETVRTAPEPAELPCGAWTVAEGPRGPRRVIPGIDALTDEGARRLALYSELGAPWARYPAPPPHDT
ncbi:Gfo/Idh/MocA family protein [Streptomyces radicis]|uniref:Gfo/Idh/MocA family oxidoreductase n=1 Tax=Streptomyces radicis TaxID=1750517 RepID=A0A3A9W7Z6_9ACTN|nr:Gfo/Idh/MocA family oxidoreductase [Streptomyces radicis]RKN03656.1 gfo/Idh/MocA family oxidoreductase [Streptomyces radicis]RKN13500.1 gfo/Idh/MocA family oxidoreductase [Streptomyces radicis]